MSFRQDALRQAWGIHNSFDEIPAEGREQVILYLGYLWGSAMNYESIPLPTRLTKDRVRQFCMKVIDDLSCGTINLQRRVAA